MPLCRDSLLEKSLSLFGALQPDSNRVLWLLLSLDPFRRVMALEGMLLTVSEFI